jgi:hypothetical protein
MGKKKKVGSRHEFEKRKKKKKRGKGKETYRTQAPP